MRWCLQGSSLSSSDSSDRRWFTEGFACGREGEVLACIEMKRAYTDAAAGKPRVQVDTPPLLGLGLGLGLWDSQDMIRVSSFVETCCTQDKG